MNTEKNKIVFQASAKDFVKIPGAPVAYWASDTIKEIYSNKERLAKYVQPKHGISTGNNGVYLRFWHEIQLNDFSDNCQDLVSTRNYKWIAYNKGGQGRKWYGNYEYCINYLNEGQKMKDDYVAGVNSGLRLFNEDFFFKTSVTWADVTSGAQTFRFSPKCTIFDGRGSSIICNGDFAYYLTSFLNSKLTSLFSHIQNPTLVTTINDIENLPFLPVEQPNSVFFAKELIHISVTDWNRYETSWDFQHNPLTSINTNRNSQTTSDIATIYQRCRQEWMRDTDEMHRLEVENNRIFIEAYGLQDELTPEVPWNEITLTCNPWYRYGVTPPNLTSNEFPVDEALEARLKADTMKEFLSYAVGCMFGRYSLDKPGLVLANQGETMADYLKQIPQPTFIPDEDNVIPILDEDWFADDIVTRFYEFLKVTFGEENFYENLAFIEEALGKDVRSYFTKDFYKDHLQRYHNRPIYWLFSSPKGAFNALVYMHRYCPETVGLVLTYLRSHITKVSERIHTLETTIDSADSTAGMKSKALRERAKLQKSLRELEDYERDVLYPLATEKIAIDLDDGVKVNYRKFGDALYKIKGLEAKEE